MVPDQAQFGLAQGEPQALTLYPNSAATMPELVCSFYCFILNAWVSSC